MGTKPLCTHNERKNTWNGIERVQALAGISRSALRCQSNETRAPIANSPSSAQLEGTRTIPPSYIRVCAVVWESGEGQTHTHRQTHMAVTHIHFASATPHATKCKKDRIWRVATKKTMDR